MTVVRTAWLDSLAWGLASIVAVLGLACSGQNALGLPAPAGAPLDTEVNRGGLVLNFGLQEYDLDLAEDLARKVSAWFIDLGLPAPARSVQVHCAELDPEPDTKACFDVRVFFPFIPDALLDALPEMVQSGDVSQVLTDDESLSTQLTYVQSRGLALGHTAPILFALRASLNTSQAELPQTRNRQFESADEAPPPPPPPAPPPTSWQGHEYTAIERAVETTLNAVYQLIIPVPFELYKDCVSNLSRVNFCGHLAADGSYSSSTWDDVCAGTCKAVYDTCKVGVDACKVACCYGCSWGRTCSCSDPCANERDKCENSCSVVVSGSAEVDVLNAKGLDNVYFLNVQIPGQNNPNSLSVVAGAKLPGGATSDVYWKMCQSGICIQQTTPLSSSTVEISAESTVYARACEGSDATALFLNIDHFNLIEPGIWNIEDFVASILGVLDSSMSWLAENIDDLFYNDIYHDYVEAYDALLTTLEELINDLLSGIPIIDCPDVEEG